MCSCIKHEEVIDTSFQVGNIYCSDGSIVHPTLFAGSGKQAVGVVFWCNDGQDKSITDAGYAVSLEDLSPVSWAELDSDISNVSEDESAFDGAANTASILAYGAANGFLTPAATNAIRYAPNGVTGWFVPSIAQCKAISLQYNKITQSFALVNGKGFSSWYWTSTEDGQGKNSPEMFALVAAFSEGRITSTRKNSLYPIRPIIAIR